MDESMVRNAVRPGMTMNRVMEMEGEMGVIRQVGMDTVMRVARGGGMNVIDGMHVISVDVVDPMHVAGMDVVDLMHVVGPMLVSGLMHVGGVMDVGDNMVVAGTDEPGGMQVGGAKMFVIRRMLVCLMDVSK